MSTVQQRHESPSRQVDPLPPLIAVLRPHQWVKNLLLLVPAVAAHRIDWTTGRSVLIAFVGLSLCASGGYVLNDVLDVNADRAHPRKRFRPIAAGQISVPTAIVLVVLTWGAGIGLSLATLPIDFVWTLLV